MECPTRCTTNLGIHRVLEDIGLSLLCSLALDPWPRCTEPFVDASCVYRRCVAGRVVSDVFVTARHPHNQQPSSSDATKYRAPLAARLFPSQLLGSIAYSYGVSHSHPIAVEAGRAAEFCKVCGVGVLDSQSGFSRMIAPEWLSRPRPLRAIPASDV
mgnify:CR=1 FL=1